MLGMRGGCSLYCPSSIQKLESRDPVDKSLDHRSHSGFQSSLEPKDPASVKVPFPHIPGRHKSIFKIAPAIQLIVGRQNSKIDMPEIYDRIVGSRFLRLCINSGHFPMCRYDKARKIKLLRFNPTYCVKFWRHYVWYRRWHILKVVTESWYHPPSQTPCLISY